MRGEVEHGALEVRRHVDVGAVLNVQSDHLGMRGIESIEQLAEVKRIIVAIDETFVSVKGDWGHFEYHPGITLAQARDEAGLTDGGMK